MEYSSAFATLTGSAPLEADIALTWIRRAMCREAGGGVGHDRGWWSLNSQERAIIICIASRANEHGVCLATSDDLAVAGCPKHSQPAAIARLADAGFLTVVGARKRRLFVLAEQPPAAEDRPDDWTPAGLHRSRRPRDGRSAPPVRSAAPAPTVSRADLMERIKASPMMPEIVATLKLATQALGVDRLDARHVLTILEAVEHSTGPSPDGQTWVRLRRAFAATNMRTDEEGRSLAATPRRWAGYFATVADAARMSGAERAAAALARADAEEAWEEAVETALDEPADEPRVESVPRDEPEVPVRPVRRAPSAPAGRTEAGARVWDAAALAAAAAAQAG